MLIMVPGGFAWCVFILLFLLQIFNDKKKGARLINANTTLRSVENMSCQEQLSKHNNLLFEILFI